MSMRFGFSLCFAILLFAGVPAFAQAIRAEPFERGPQSPDGRAFANRFAGSDLIRQPTGIAFTQSGKLLVVQSNTHFRPEDYDGSENDEIFWLRDDDGDGTADSRSLFYGENLVATMDLAVHPETGAVYVATRNEILRLWDENGDGVADEDRIERRLVFLDTEGDYPHNGISGLAFDDLGNLLFGIGENLGAAYTLIGSDDRKISDQGEGGNIWFAEADGGGLRRFSTGFWNPFGVCTAPGNFVFATDNDPSSRPPSRLHFCVLGSDHGYQYRYGRSGLHPFVSWDGELPGTFPMLHGSGEAPCDVIHHEGSLYVASWGDRRIERYPLAWNGTAFSATQEIVLESEGEFRPVAFAVSPDGELYCSDWVKSDYKLHDEGAVWRIGDWSSSPRPMPGPEARIALMRAPIEEGTIADDRYWTEPWLSAAAISSLSKRIGKDPEPPRPDDPAAVPDPRKRAILMLARRKNDPSDPEDLAGRMLADPDNEVRLLALKWISDERLSHHAEAVDRMVHDPPTPDLFLAAVTAAERIQDRPVTDEDLRRVVAARISEPEASQAMKRAGFRILPEREKALSVAEFRGLYEEGDEELRIDVLVALRTHPDQKGAKEFAESVIADPESPRRCVRFAREIAGGPASPFPAGERPSPEDVAGWIARIDAAFDPDREATSRSDGGRILFHRHCAICHVVDGFGRRGGPDLTTIHERGREHVLRSILEPSAEVAPQYEPWRVVLTDGSEKTGFLLGQRGGNSFFADVAGEEFEVDYRDIAKREQLPVSAMPPGLQFLLSDEEMGDLLFYLVGSRESGGE